MTVPDAWYKSQKFEQERLVSVVAAGYMKLAEKHGINNPTISFIDVFGKEVAFWSPLRGMVIVSSN